MNIPELEIQFKPDLKSLKKKHRRRVKRRLKREWISYSFTPGVPPIKGRG